MPIFFSENGYYNYMKSMLNSFMCVKLSRKSILKIFYYDEKKIKFWNFNFSRNNRNKNNTKVYGITGL